MNHSWRDDDPDDEYGLGEPLNRTCSKCGAQGRRDVTRQGAFTRWETRLQEGSEWEFRRVPPCPAKRPRAYVPVSERLRQRLVREGIVPAGAELKLETVRNRPWGQLPTAEHPNWRGTWSDEDGEYALFSTAPMRRCAEAPGLILWDGLEVIPAGEAP